MLGLVSNLLKGKKFWIVDKKDVMIEMEMKTVARLILPSESMWQPERRASMCSALTSTAESRTPGLSEILPPPPAEVLAMPGDELE